MTAVATLAIGWMPEIRGILTVLIAVVVFIGSVYLLLGTNVGARLGFLISIAGLAAWMASMGAIWWAYGLGLKGRDPTWVVANGVNLIRTPTDLDQSHIINDVAFDLDENAPFPEQAATADDQLREGGWRLLAEDDPQRGQAIASADEIIQQEFELYAAGDYIAVNVFDKGGEAWPKISDAIDFTALRHNPHYALVEIAPVVEQRTEPGRAPATPIPDENAPHEYVLMVRDLGSKRQPATFLTLGAGLIFGASCWLLHRRDRVVATHLAEAKG
jgi:hypothetical protein